MISSFLIAYALQQPGGGVLIPDWEVLQNEFKGEADVLAVPDLNGDQLDDWVLSFGATNGNGVLTLVSGADGSPIWETLGATHSILRMIDLENDGRYELIVGRQDDFLRCYDAHTGALQWDAGGVLATNFPAGGLELIDVDHDGKLELLASDASEGSRRTVIHTACLDSDGGLIWSASMGLNDGYNSAARFVDLNQDGVLDLVHGDPGFWVHGGPLNEGIVQAIDGVNGAVMWEARGGRTHGLLGANLDAIDLDGDGAVEILARSPGGHAFGLPDAGLIVVLDGASGHLNWHVEGTETSQRLGEIVAYGDLDADGTTDLVLGMPNALGGDGSVRAVDGKSGSSLWLAEDWPRSGDNFGRHVAIWQDQPGSAAQVVIQASLLPTAQENELRGYDFRRGDSGRRIAAHPLEIEASFRPKFELIDLDQDRNPEVYFFQPLYGGVIGAVDESAGLLWKRFGGGIGRDSFLRQESGSSNWIVFTQSEFAGNGIQDSRRVLALQARTGKQVWEFQGTRISAQMGRNLELVDDPQLAREVLIASAQVRMGSPEFAEVHVIDPGTGTAIAAFRNDDPGRIYNFPRLVRAVDSDLDGKHELLVVSTGSWKQYPAMPVRRELLSIAGGPISVSQGGTAELQLDFGAPCAWYEYEVLVGAHGVGRATETTLDIPLRRDRLLGLSLERRIPGGMMPRSFGVLDAFGKEAVELRIAPGQFPLAAVGRSLHFCVQARRPWSGWEYCSIPVELRFVP